MTGITIKSNVCGFVHKVRGKLEGKKITIDIDTPCQKIKKFSHMEVPKLEVFDIRDNYVIQKAREADCSATCIVPSAVLHACWLEAGYMSKSLVNGAGTVCMEFDEIDAAH